MNKTLYVPDSKREIWKRAERTARLRGTTLSAMITALLEHACFNESALKHLEEWIQKEGKA